MSLVGFSDFFLMNILWQRGCDSFLKVGCWKSMTSFLAALCHSLLCSLLEKPASLFRSALWGVPWGKEGMSSLVVVNLVLPLATEVSYFFLP